MAWMASAGNRRGARDRNDLRIGSHRHSCQRRRTFRCRVRAASGGGGAVTDPNPHSLFGQAFLELQFYPDCPSYGGPFCTYPWYALNSNGKAFTFGADYPGTLHDYGQGFQFATTPQCGGPFGPDSTFCDTTLSPVP